MSMLDYISLPCPLSPVASSYYSTHAKSMRHETHRIRAVDCAEKTNSKTIERSSNAARASRVNATIKPRTLSLGVNFTAR